MESNYVAILLKFPPPYWPIEWKFMEIDNFAF